VPPTTLSESLPAAAAARVDSDERLAAVARDNVRVVWRFLRRLGLSEEDAEDATQEVMVIVARKLAGIRVGSERAFALSTAFRVASSFRRAKRQRREVTAEALATLTDPSPAPDAAVEQRRALELLDRMLDCLSEEHRAVFVAAEFEGLSLTEIAEVMSIPRGTAASRLRTAREEFRAHVARHEARARHKGGAR
jgi:RNA polymerase sigma-70 factor, ECF subfamily